MKHLFAYLLYAIIPGVILFNSSFCFSQTLSCTYGGSGYSEGHSVAQCSDGGFIITGLTKCFGDTSGNIYLIKTDKNGVIQWQQIHGSPALDGGNSVVTCPDGGYFIAGHTEGWGAGDCDGFAMKTDSRGDSVWMNTYGDTSDDVAYDGIYSNDGNYVMTGYTTIAGSRGEDVFLCKFDDKGNRLWVKLYGGNGDEIAWSLKQTPDNGYIIAGYSSSFTTNGNSQIYLIKTDENGNLQWQKTYGSNDSLNYRAYKVILTPDGGYALVGYFGNFDYGANSFLLKTDANGNEIWMQQYNYNQSYYLARSLSPTTDKGYLLTGECYGNGDSSKIILVKTDSLGNAQWSKTIGKQNLTYYAYNIIQATGNKYAFIATEQKNETEYDFLLMVIDSIGETTSVSKGPLNNTISVTAYPNPATDNITFQLQYYSGTYSVYLYDALGHLVRQYSNQVITTLNVGRKDLPSGIYFYKIENATAQIITKGKIVLQ